MRPILRNASPLANDFDNYKDAQKYLVARLGPFCSYCERRIATNLAVEHIQPKDGVHGHPPLIGRWTNFLVACVNCNSTKGAKEVILTDLLLPDRDNTFSAYHYTADGKISPAIGLSPAIKALAEKTLKLTGLDKPVQVFLDENDEAVALDRVSQRMEVWGIAECSKVDIDADPTNVGLRNATIRAALGHGFFSIWMTVFAGDIDMRNRLIDAFLGTRRSGCFNQLTTLPIHPAPNLDRLANGGKF